MRNNLFKFLFVSFFLCSAAKAQILLPDYGDGINASEQAIDIKLRQAPQYILQIVATGKKYLPHVETLDGYTVVRNLYGNYEYGVNNKQGDIVSSGIVAHNPPDRKHEELSFLQNTKKHINFFGAKLAELTVLQKDYEKLNVNIYDVSQSIDLDRRFSYDDY